MKKVFFCFLLALATPIIPIGLRTEKVTTDSNVLLFKDLQITFLAIVSNLFTVTLEEEKSIAFDTLTKLQLVIDQFRNLPTLSPVLANKASFLSEQAITIRDILASDQEALLQ